MDFLKALLHFAPDSAKHAQRQQASSSSALSQTPGMEGQELTVVGCLVQDASHVGGQGLAGDQDKLCFVQRCQAADVPLRTQVDSSHARHMIFFQCRKCRKATVMPAKH